MEIISNTNVNLKEYGKQSNCITRILHVKVDDLHLQAKEIIEMITDTSWIDELDGFKKIAYQACSERTINKLVQDVLSNVGTAITEEFGEILVSNVARISLEEACSHESVPLAELWKEKLTGNPGFDFHSESSSCILCFGEAKYSGSTNPYAKALNQINDFIELKKDKMELKDLANFVSKEAIDNCCNNEKGFIAAFSLNSKKYNLIFEKILNSDLLSEVLKYNELYIIGVEV